MSDGTNAELLTIALSRRKAIVGVATAVGRLALNANPARAADKEEISHDAETIHQEPFIKASRLASMRRSPTLSSSTDSSISVTR
jgi:hypothetical protein